MKVREEIIKNKLNYTESLLYKIKKLEAENKLLKKFVRHEDNCATQNNFGINNCDCSLANILYK